MSDLLPGPPDRSTAEGITPAVELIDITKAFPGVVANDHISIAAMPGEVLCLLGENGAGKSTLMSILSGLYQPDGGQIKVDGREVRIDSPKSGRELGIGMVYQHLSLIPTLSVLENLMLGSNPGLILDAGAARSRLVELSTMLGVSLDPDVITGTLALGQQQQIEIIKALWKGSRVLILDEPTTMLTPQGIEELQKVLMQIKASGLAIIFITHKLHEAIAMGDRVAVLKLGKVVGHIGNETLRAETPHQLQQRIVALMFGEQPDEAADIAELREEVGIEHATRKMSDTPVLEVVDAVAPGSSGQHGIEGVSLSVRGGEILGVGGVDGNGQQALAQVIAGQQSLASGQIRMGGTSITSLGVSERQRAGLRYVTDDRLGEGVVAPYAVSLNMVLKRIGQPPFWRRGAIDRPKINATARALIGEFDIRTPNEETRIGALSGGNIQKTLLARELSFEPKVVVFSKPTHGLDVRTIAMVRTRIRELAERGVGIIVISTDLDELVDLRTAWRCCSKAASSVRWTPAQVRRLASVNSSSAGWPRERIGSDSRRDGIGRAHPGTTPPLDHLHLAGGHPVAAGLPVLGPHPGAAGRRSGGLLRRHHHGRHRARVRTLRRHHADGPDPAHRMRSHLRLSRQPLEPRHRRPVPARGRLRRWPRPRGHGGRSGGPWVGDPVAGSHGRWRCLDAHPIDAQGALWHQ